MEVDGQARGAVAQEEGSFLGLTLGGIDVGAGASVHVFDLVAGVEQYHNLSSRGNGGTPFGEVVTALEEQGYTVAPITGRVDDGTGAGEYLVCRNGVPVQRLSAVPVNGIER